MRNNEKNKNMLDKVLLTIGIILVIYYLVITISFGTISFSGMFLLGGIILSIYGIMEIKYKVNIWRKLNKKIRIILTVVFLIGISVFTLLEAVIIYHGNHIDKDKPQYLVVLGAGLNGTKISLSLKDRLDTAIEFNGLHSDVEIVVSGGQGEGEDITEALAMKNYLIDNGVAEKLIIMEDESTSTYENFLFTKELLSKLDGNENHNITIISNGFHMYRAKYLAKKVGFETKGYPAPSRIGIAPIFYVREFFGVIKAYIFGS